ncbi:hypothetical protein F4677DRAFT_96926 [Hypoxylon crocopeplum]|nr:hypothetical protein F4677DRAFT_96926 [Hypoxylon crocopeplum]
MSEPKKGLWSGLMRKLSNARERSRYMQEREVSPRRTSDGDAPLRRRNTERPERSSSRRRPRRPNPRDSKGKGKGKERSTSHEYGPTPLSEWPPSGVSSRVTLGRAMELISKGVPVHKGHKRPIPHASENYYVLFTTTAGNHREENDAADQHNAMVQFTTLRIQDSGPPDYPWETLEQPSRAFGYGARPGTITLNHWATLFSAFPPLIGLRDPGMVPREVGLIQIFNRLKDLEAYGLEDDTDELYRLYKRFLRDPDKVFNPRKSMERQITDLVVCLSSPDWIDFSDPMNQVVTQFIYETGSENIQQYRKFYYQLLLSLELELRINSRQHTERAKARLMTQIPPKIQWNLALARRWRDYVRIDEYGETADWVKLRYRIRKRQIRMLRKFAQMMKWPNLDETLDELKERDTAGTLMSISSHASAFFSGLVLPGPTFPFLMMNTLIDIDPDGATDNIALLTPVQPHCGFQYQNSYTYWSSNCIVGKVLAPTCLDLAGWIGPARPTVDLKPSQMALIHSKKPQHTLTAHDVTSMSNRSDPLGPPSEVYPLEDYHVAVPNADDIIDTVRIKQLNLKAVPGNRGSGPKWFEASIQFDVDGVSWPVHLAFNVSFINAWPCSNGPHPLFFDFTYIARKVDELVDILDWGTPNNRERQAGSTSVNGSRPEKTIVREDDEMVLVVEAFGPRDNEVLARAWCSQWGLSAIVVDIGKTCMGCAIREAYAATLTVVILVEDPPEGVE